MDRNIENKFWKIKDLEDFTTSEWESLCDGCGQCCMNKIEDEDSGAIFETSICCTLLDAQTCRCKHYQDRQSLIPDCVQLTKTVIDTLPWLPETCAYRQIAEGRDLCWWHPLVSGDANTVHEAGISVRNKIKLREDQVTDVEDYMAYITKPLFIPSID